jgi:hypothetical protein
MKSFIAGRCSIAILLLPTLTLAPSRADDAPKTYPAHILIIRHAEKPPADAASPDLSAEGRDRAEALPKLFLKADNRPEPFPTPDFLFATGDSKDSRRPTETVAPLAKALGLKVNDRFGVADGAKLADELFHDPKYAGKTILLCWRHHMIPELAGLLKADGAPDVWNPDVFDRVWRIDYDKGGKAKFSNLPQRLMPKDSEK